MQYPHFFNDIPIITMQDELANFLGSSKNGIVSYQYIDIVKVTGHSCPTVLGAYMMLEKGLKKLYKSKTPLRGDISIEFKEDLSNGVTGVIATITTMITGATSNYGFKGISGEYNRCDLMSFNNDIKGIMRITRNDTNESVVVDYDISSIQRPKRLGELMKKCLDGAAVKEEQEEFKVMWQKGVERIFLNIDNYLKVN